MTPESTQPDGTVTRQNIVSGSAIKKGSIVDIWVAGTEPPPEESKNEDPTNE